MNISGNDIALTVLAIVVGLIGWFMKEMKKGHDNKQAEQDVQIKEVKDLAKTETDKLRKELTDLALSLPDRYVMREDFLRITTGIEMKVDSMMRDVGKLNENVSKLIERTAKQGARGDQG